MEKIKAIREKLNSMADTIREAVRTVDDMAEALEDIANEIADHCAAPQKEPLEGFAAVREQLRAGISPAPGQIITTRLTDGIVAKWRVIDTKTMARRADTCPIVVQLAEILDYRPFSTPDKAHPWGWNDYETSSLASWLDEAFFKRLSDDDQACILRRHGLDDPLGGHAMWLLSDEEAGFGDLERAFDWYACEDEDERAQRRQLRDSDGDAANWWLRTPPAGTATSVRYVYTSGALYNGSASHAHGVAPACIIG